MKKLLVIFLLVSNGVCSQYYLSTSINYTKTDFFHGIEVGKTLNRCQFFTGFEYGIVRTIFQGRFFPKAKLGFAYLAVNRPKITLSPILQYDFSSLKYSKTQHGTTNYHQLTTGFRWQYGSKWKIGQTCLIGALWERYFNSIFNEKQTAKTLGFVAQIDVIYVF